MNKINDYNPKEHEPYPACRHKDCFANTKGKCNCLYDNDFKGKACPFYKSHRRPYPTCGHTDCFANKHGKCTCLYDNDFSTRACPFLKTVVLTIRQ